jgi:hypothetical protein
MNGLMDTEAAAAFLKVRPTTLISWRNKRTGPTYYKVGRLVYYDPSLLSQWLESRMTVPHCQ